VVSLSSAAIEARHRWEPSIWQSAPLLPNPASTLLVTWTVEPVPVDSGMPPVIQAPFAEALCALGDVVYAADADAQTAAPQIAQLQLRSGFRRCTVRLFHAHSAAQVLPAFESAKHAWSMNAQWLMVTRGPPEVELLESLVRVLFEDWRLPVPWPEGVLLLVQAGVDGDAAICHCRDRSIDDLLCAGLRRTAIESGAHFKLLD
jgi:hypothetical protein